MPHILQLLNHIHGDLRKLILTHYYLGEDRTGLLDNIAALFPDLEVLSMEGCSSRSSAGFRSIPRLEKLSELKLAECEVDYVYVKPLEAHVCIRECM